MEALKTNVPGFAVDYFGNDIKVGDLVVYPNRSGSSMWMNHGTVKAIGMRPDDYSPSMQPVLQIEKVPSNYDITESGTRRVEVVCLDRVVALGRGWENSFSPQRAPEKEMDSTLDRVIAWLRSKIHRG
jgi:hypothetical protein